VPDDGDQQAAGVRALARRFDSDPRLLTAVDRLRERLPGDSRFGDPLSVTGDRPAEALARAGPHPKHPSAVHELGLGALQVWQSLSEAAGRGMGDETLTLLFTDLVGFSSWALEAGDSAALELLRDVGVSLEGAIEAREGRVVKRLGDGLMATFLTPQAAVEAALDTLDELGDIEVAGHHPRLRAGVHHGSPRKLGNDYFGVDVNIAARVGAQAKPDQVLVSEPACSLLDPMGLELGRARKLKAPGAPAQLRVRPVSRA